MSTNPVTVIAPGAVVVFHRMTDGWAAICFPGPTGLGDTPQSALSALLKSWPTCLDDAIAARARQATVIG